MTYASQHESAKTLSLGIALIFLSGLIAGLVLPLTQSLAGFQDGDGILTSLISTQKLTWYFWGQDRLLNVIPALASPFTDIEINLRFQVILRSFFAYLAPVGILIFFTKSPRFLLVAIAITNIIIISSLSQYAQFNYYVQHNTFGTSLVLFAIAYALTFSRFPKILIAVLVLLICSIAYATNYALLTYSLPAITLLGMLRKPERKRFILFLLLNLVAILIARYHSQIFGTASTKYGLLISLEGMIDSARVIYLNTHLRYLLLFSAITVLCYRMSPEKKFLELSAIFCVGAGLVILLANTLWLQMNAYSIRYFLTSELIIASVMAFIITRSLMTGKYKYPLIISVIGLLHCIFFSLGGFTSSYKELVGEPWREDSLAVAKLASDEGVQVITGGFWDVWPAVYETKKLQRIRPVFGAAFRGSVLKHDFLAATKGKGEMTALCFFNTVELCTNEMVKNYALTGNNHLVVKHTEQVTAGDKKLIKMIFEVN